MYRIHHQFWLVNTLIVCTYLLYLLYTHTHTHSVAIAVPITGLLTGLITSVITSIIVYCIMKNKENTLRERSPVDIGPIYNLPTINNEQQEQVTLLMDKFNYTFIILSWQMYMYRK